MPPGTMPFASLLARSNWVALAAAFGLELDAEEVAITVSVVATIVAFVQRKLVTPNAKK